MRCASNVRACRNRIRGDVLQEFSPCQPSAGINHRNQGVVICELAGHHVNICRRVVRCLVAHVSSTTVVNGERRTVGRLWNRLSKAGDHSAGLEVDELRSGARVAAHQGFLPVRSERHAVRTAVGQIDLGDGVGSRVNDRDCAIAWRRLRGIVGDGDINLPHGGAIYRLLNSALISREALSHKRDGGPPRIRRAVASVKGDLLDDLIIVPLAIRSGRNSRDQADKGRCRNAESGA